MAAVLKQRRHELGATLAAWAYQRRGAVVIGIFVLALAGKLARYLSPGALLVVVALQALLAVFFLRNFATLSSRIPPRTALAVACLSLAMLAILGVVMHPLLEDWLRGSGAGSDRDEALELASRAVLAGNDPYAIKLSTGNPVSALPGELFLAFPFVVTGHATLMNVAVIAFWYGILHRLAGASRACVGLLGLVSLAPGVLHEIVTAGDLFAMSILIASLLVLILERSHEPWSRTLLSVALGVALSSRITWLLLVPPLFISLVRIAGLRRATSTVVPLLATFAAVTLPFAWNDLQGFQPLHVFARIDLLAGVSHAALGVLTLSAVCAVCAASFTPRTTANFVLGSACLMLAPVLSSTLVVVRSRGWSGIESFLWYSLWSVPFAMTAVVLDPPSFTPTAVPSAALHSDP